MKEICYWFFPVYFNVKKYNKTNYVFDVYTSKASFIQSVETFFPELLGTFWLIRTKLQLQMKKKAAGCWMQEAYV